MDRKIQGPFKVLLPICMTACLVCVALSLALQCQRQRIAVQVQATQTTIASLTTQHGEELTDLIERFEGERREAVSSPDLVIQVTALEVLEYDDSRSQAYGAVAIQEPRLISYGAEQTCGFCAVYVFQRAHPQEAWQSATFVPIMGSAADHVRDWAQHKDAFTGLVDVRPEWRPCPYAGCGLGRGE